MKKRFFFLIAYAIAGLTVYGIWQWGLKTGEPMPDIEGELPYESLSSPAAPEPQSTPQEPSRAATIGGQEKAFASGGIAQGFPADIPIYSPARVEVSQFDNAQRSAAAHLVTQDRVGLPARFYKNATPAKGWEIVSYELTERGAYFSDTFTIKAVKDGRVLQVGAYMDETGTNISIGVEPESGG